MSGRRLTFALKIEIDKQLLQNTKQQTVAVRLADFVGPDNELSEYRVARVSARVTSTNVPLPLLVDVWFSEHGGTRRGDRVHAAVAKISADTHRAELVPNETELSGMMIVQPNSTAAATVDDFTNRDAAAFDQINCPGWTFARLRRECEHGSETIVVSEEHPVWRVLHDMGRANGAGWISARATKLGDGRIAVRRECFQHIIDEIHNRLERKTAEQTRVALNASFKPLVEHGAPWDLTKSLDEVPVHVYSYSGGNMSSTYDDRHSRMTLRGRAYITLEFILLLEAPPENTAARQRA